MPDGQIVKIRLAALVTETGCCRVVLRSSENAFQVDHFSATCRIGGHYEARMAAAWRKNSFATVPLVPSQDLYGRILFHSGRFRWVRSYHRLRAKECIAEIAASSAENWFSRYLPPALPLGDRPSKILLNRQGRPSKTLLHAAEHACTSLVLACTLVNMCARVSCWHARQGTCLDVARADLHRFVYPLITVISISMFSSRWTSAKRSRSWLIFVRTGTASSASS